jgi:hypothetical protein
MSKKKTIEQKKKILEGTHTPLEKKVLLADLVRVTTTVGTTLTAPVSYIDRYHIEMGNIIIPKHAVEMYELDPESEEEDEDEAEG